MGLLLAIFAVFGAASLKPAKYVTVEQNDLADCVQSAISPDHSYVFYVDSQGQVLYSLLGNMGTPTTLAMTPMNSIPGLISFAKNSTLAIYSTVNTLYEFRLVGTTWQQTAFKVSTSAMSLRKASFPNDPSFVLFTKNQFVVYNIPSQTLYSPMTCPGISDCGLTVFLSKTDSLVTVGKQTSILAQYDYLLTTIRIQSIPQFTAVGQPATSMVLSDDDRLLAVGFKTQVLVLDEGTWTVLCSLQVLSASMYGLQLKFDGDLLYFNSKQSKMQAINLTSCAIQYEVHQSDKTQGLSFDLSMNYLSLCNNRLAVFAFNTCSGLRYFNYHTQSCQACPAECEGCYWGSSFSCLKCSENAVSLNSASSVCQFCAYGFYKNDNSCVVMCPSGKFLQREKCMPCNSECSVCLSLETCLACASPQLLWQQLCFSDCPVGSFQNAFLNCIGCPAQCLACSISNFCQSCNAGLLYYSGTCRSFCPASHYSLNQACHPCPAGCSTCSGNKCLICNQISIKFEGNCVSSCLEGFVQIDGQCLPCLLYCQKLTLTQVRVCAPYQVHVLITLSRSVPNLQSLLNISTIATTSIRQVAALTWLMSFQTATSHIITMQLAKDQKFHPESTLKLVLNYSFSEQYSLVKSFICPIASSAFTIQFKLDFSVRYLIGLSLFSARLYSHLQPLQFATVARTFSVFVKNSPTSNQPKIFGSKAKHLLLAQTYPALIVLVFCALAQISNMFLKSALLQLFCDYTLYQSTNFLLYSLLAEHQSAWQPIVVAIALLLSGSYLCSKIVRSYVLLRTRLVLKQQFTTHMWLFSVFKLDLQKSGETSTELFIVLNIWLSFLTTMSVLLSPYPTVSLTLAIVPSLSRLILYSRLRPFRCRCINYATALLQLNQTLSYCLLLLFTRLKITILAQVAGLLGYVGLLGQIALWAVLTFKLWLQKDQFQERLRQQLFGLIAEEHCEQQLLDKFVVLGNLNDYQPALSTVEVALQYIQSDMINGRTRVLTLGNIRARSASYHLGQGLPKFQVKVTQSSLLEKAYPEQLKLLLTILQNRAETKCDRVCIKVLALLQNDSAKIIAPCNKLEIAFFSEKLNGLLSLAGKDLVLGFPLSM